MCGALREGESQVQALPQTSKGDVCFWIPRRPAAHFVVALLNTRVVQMLETFLCCIHMASLIPRGNLSMKHHCNLKFINMIYIYIHIFNFNVYI